MLNKILAKILANKSCFFIKSSLLRIRRDHAKNARILAIINNNYNEFTYSIVITVP